MSALPARPISLSQPRHERHLPTFAPLLYLGACTEIRDSFLQEGRLAQG